MSGKGNMVTRKPPETPVAPALQPSTISEGREARAAPLQEAARDPKGSHRTREDHEVHTETRWGDDGGR